MVSKLAAVVEKWDEHWSPNNTYARDLLPGLVYALRKFAYAQSSVDLARVACALERYRLAHNEFPESLDALSPQFIKKVPHDIIGGQPLHYRRTSDGTFLLYSIGWNETDDGGIFVFREYSTYFVDDSKSDWVWKN
jgi:nanoRNase/pAp phosphatase (c-di-AMP/oligoRNAs hydrolase)